MLVMVISSPSPSKSRRASMSRLQFPKGIRPSAGSDPAAGAAFSRRRSTLLMRANIAELPDGTYSCDDWLDNDGIIDAPLKIALDLTIAGDLDIQSAGPATTGSLVVNHSSSNVDIAGDDFPGLIKFAKENQVELTVIGPEEWDQVIVVKYPSRDSFIEMTQNPEYLEISKYRTDSLQDSRLFLTKQE